TLPSATAGVDRGPRLKPPSPGQFFAGAAYDFDRHFSLPLLVSRHSSRSSPFSRVKTKMRSPATTGDATPSPTVTFHSSFRLWGHFFGPLTPRTPPSRFGPRHCVQAPSSSAAFSFAGRSAGPFSCFAGGAAGSSAGACRVKATAPAPRATATRSTAAAVFSLLSDMVFSTPFARATAADGPDVPATNAPASVPLGFTRRDRT